MLWCDIKVVKMVEELCFLIRYVGFIKFFEIINEYYLWFFRGKFNIILWNKDEWLVYFSNNEVFFNGCWEIYLIIYIINW